MIVKEEILPSRVELSGAQRVLLEQRLQKARQTAAKSSTEARSSIPRRAAEGEIPLSFAQERLWFLGQLEPGAVVYNLCQAVRVRGALDLVALEKAVNEIIRRHEILRTNFGLSEGRAIQTIAATRTLSLAVVDLSTWGEGKTEDGLQRLLQEEARRPFDFARDLLLRAFVVRVSATEHTLMLSMHHIISDGWSIGILFRELAAYYTGFCTGEPAVLPELPIQYADFVKWERHATQVAALEKPLAYWKQQLAGPLPVLELPVDHLRPASDVSQGAAQSINLSKALSPSLKTLGQQEGVTMFMTLLAAFQVLLHRWTGQEDIVIGSVVAGRRKVELEKLIGFFINTVVFRGDLSGEPTFRELLGRVRETALAALAHQDLPFDQLVKELRPDRAASRNPLFQVLFVLQNAPMTPTHLPGLSMEPLDVDTGTTKFDLTLSMMEMPQGIRAALEYNADIFEASTMARMLDAFQTLLESIVADPGQRISRLALLAPATQQQLLHGWNDTRLNYPQTECIHPLFEAQARRTPEATAVLGEGARLTYRELDRRANQLAARLRAEGIGPESLVGIFLERTPQLLVGVLGVLKAGGAYVPLDPAYPADRLEFVVGHARMTIVVTERALAARAPAGNATLMVIEVEGGAAAPSGDPLPAFEQSAQSLAYVIYTSGSTGRPKGVAVEHRSVAALIAWARQVYQPEELAGVLASTSVCFDVSVFEMFVPLCTGGTVIVAENILHAPRLTGPDQITLMSGVPSAVAELVRMEQLPSSVRTVNLAGEPCPQTLVESLYRQPNVKRVLDLYGPTETTVYSTYALRTAGGRATIGRPLANEQTYVLDRVLQPVPVGVPGELYIGGDGLARGYLHQPELTAERFVTNPFHDGQRLYRTGDRVRYLEDGNIEFLGRLDHQIKLRGHRIELLEIDAVLRKHPGVRECVVILRADQPNDPRLVAYFVPAEAGALEARELRRHVQERLPDYMLPSIFVELAKLPVTPNGKLDRRALPVPEFDLAVEGAALVAPRTASEELLAGIWCGVLGLKQVGVHDNFFELGGHSLLATQVISRVRERLGVELTLRQFFSEQTIAGLAGAIDATLRTGQSNLPIPRQRSREEVPLSFAQERLWFLAQLDPGTAVYNLCAAARLKGPLDLAALENALNEIVRRHEALRTNFVALDGRPVQAIAASRTLELSLVDLSEGRGGPLEEEVQRKVQEEARRPFDLTRELLVRAFVVRAGPTDHALVITMHHIISDGWSIGILFRELATLYASYCAGESPKLPELAIQFADFVRWERDQSQGPAFEQSLAYWKKQLGGTPAMLELPLDRPRSAAPVPRGAGQALALSPQLTSALKALGQQEGATLFMTLLAAFQVLLHRWTGQEDIFVGSVVAGRRKSELEQLIGFFVNTLVFRGDLTGNPTFQELLARVRETSFGAFAHDNLPFERLVQELRPDRNFGRNPLFQVMFVLQNAPMAPAELPRLSVEPIDVETGTAKFDLTLSIIEMPQGMCAGFEYNAEVFEPETISRMLGCFKTLLESIVAHPGERISKLPLLNPVGRNQLVAGINQTKTDYPRGKTMVELFQEQVTLAPASVAVQLNDRALTYQQLDARASQLALRLQGAGVGTDTLVGVCLERSLELIVALVAILKAGGAYVSLDPAYPQERLAFMLEDTRTPLLITQKSLRGKLPPHAATVICLDEAPSASDDGRAPGARSENQHGSNGHAQRPTAESLAYVSYTSGSTGKPKGVCVPHRGVVRLVKNTDFARFGRDEVFLQFAPIAFDASTLEIWGALLNGGRLVVVPPGSASLAELGAVIEQRGITTLWLTAGLFHQMVEEQLDSLRNVRQLLAGGDVLSVSHVTRALERLPKTNLINGYGPTENTTFTCCHRITTPPMVGRTVPIGRPIANTTVYILDREMQPAPIGVPGELFTGGDGLARGYLNRPELTQEKFVADPFSTEPGARLYRTGDLARWLPDGTVEFLGRIDRQVKIRGFRVEPAEIEAILGTHPAVKECAIVVRNDATGGKCLAAYVVSKQLPAPAADTWRVFLEGKVPAYLVPSSFVTLDVLPLNANGKVDVGALPVYDGSRPELQGQYVAPRDEVERQLATIWSSVLGVHTIGVHDRFFDLGGHSLLAVRMVARLDRQFGQKLPVAAIFQHRTIDQLAKLLRDGGQGYTPASSVVEIQGQGKRPPVYFVHGVGGGMFWGYSNLARHLGTDHPIYAFKSRGLEDLAEWPSIEEMAKNYITDLRAHQPQGPYLVGGYCYGGVVAYEMSRQLESMGEKVSLLALINCSPPNTDYERPDRRRLGWKLKFLRNIVYWIGCFCVSWTSRERKEFVRWKLAVLRRRASGTAGVSQNAHVDPTDLDELLNLGGYTLKQRELWQHHVGLLSAYRPQPYGGHVTLFRTRGHALMTSFDEYYGWGGLVRGGLTMKIMPGGHGNILDEPHVRAIAKAFKGCVRDAAPPGKGVAP